MKRTAGGLLGIIVLVGATAVPAGAQTEGGATCAGIAVTIHFDDPGVGLTITGTGGPDVIQGGPLRETINAGGSSDVVCGGGGDDDIDGGAGTDQLFGEDGSDDFKGPDLGQDLITGGSRYLDRADYRNLATGVEVNLGTGLVHAVGAGANGRAVGVEIVEGTAFADKLVGGPGPDALSGRGGADEIDGRGGSDILGGGGGVGVDRVTYINSNSAIVVRAGMDTVISGAAGDTIDGFEALVGSRFDDRIVGTDLPNELFGAGGDDVIKGRGDDDILDGGGGDDTIFPGPGDDYVDGGANTPVTSSGAPGDLVSYQGDVIDRDDGRRQFEVYLYTSQIGSPPGSFGVGQDEFTNIESARGVKNGKNLFQGNDGPNVFIGGDGQDYLEGRGGNDLVYGLGGADLLFGDYAAGASPGIFGDDYLDAGGPTGDTDGDSNSGGGGDDTCTGAKPAFSEDCETVF